MIKKQYSRYRYATGPYNYFDNFLETLDINANLDQELKPYNATIAKSKYSNSNGYKINVKWNDPKLYSLFVLRWS